MKTITISCDISDMLHSGNVKNYSLDVIFDHDQEDGASKTKPYFQPTKIDMCESCCNYMLDNKRYVYGYGAMGHNKYYLRGDSTPPATEGKT